MHRVRIADGPEYSCDADDTLLRAGLRAGLGFPNECNAGSCGTC
jgi:toluene monooxygenase electron transfer component